MRAQRTESSQKVAWTVSKCREGCTSNIESAQCHNKSNRTNTEWPEGCASDIKMKTALQRERFYTSTKRQKGWSHIKMIAALQWNRPRRTRWLEGRANHIRIPPRHNVLIHESQKCDHKTFQYDLYKMFSISCIFFLRRKTCATQDLDIANPVTTSSQDQTFKTW